MDIATQLKMNVASLQEQLLSAHPFLPGLLKDIHKQLGEDPANVTLLSEEEIGIIVSGLMRQTQQEIATSITKSGKGKAIKSLTLDDL